jgi:hypothetical protein
MKCEFIGFVEGGVSSLLKVLFSICWKWLGKTKFETCNSLPMEIFKCAATLWIQACVYTLSTNSETKVIIVRFFQLSFIIHSPNAFFLPYNCSYLVFCMFYLLHFAIFRIDIFSLFCSSVILVVFLPTPWNKVLLEKLIIIQLVKLRTLWELRCSLPNSQDPALGPM